MYSDWHANKVIFVSLWIISWRGGKSRSRGSVRRLFTLIQVRDSIAGVDLARIREVGRFYRATGNDFLFDFLWPQHWTSLENLKSKKRQRICFFLLFFVPLLDKEEIEHFLHSTENSSLAAKSRQVTILGKRESPRLSLNTEHFLFMGHQASYLPLGICFLIYKMREIIVPTPCSCDEDSRKWCI